MIIVGIVILFFGACIFIALPLWAKLIVLMVNSFFPDPIPVVDEVLMTVAIIKDIMKIYKAMKIVEWIRIHKIFSICIGIGIIVLVIAIIFLVSQSVGL